MVKWIIIGVSVVTVILIAFIAAAYYFPTFREATRDIAIVLLAVLQMISAILLISILFGILYLMNSLNKIARESVIPKIDTLSVKVNEVLDTTKTIAGSVRETTTTVGTTTNYVAERVVSPVIRISGLFAGVRAAATTLARRDDVPEDSQV